MIPGRFSTLLLSCWSEGNAVVLVLKGSRLVSLPFSPLGCAGISFGIGFFLVFSFSLVVAVLFYFRQVVSGPSPLVLQLAGL